MVIMLTLKEANILYCEREKEKSIQIKKNEDRVFKGQ